MTAWLENIKLEEHVECFQENRVNGKVLLQCDHECLENFGVVSKPDRIKILTRRKAVESLHGMKHINNNNYYPIVYCLLLVATCKTEIILLTHN